MKSVGVLRSGFLPSPRYEGGTDDFFSIDHSGYRAGQVLDGNGDPIGGILVGCLNTKTNKFVGYVWSQPDGSYRVDGLRSNTDQYLMLAYPDPVLLEGEYDFATRYAIT